MKKIAIIILLLLAILAAYWVAYGVNPFKKWFGSSTKTNDGTVTEKTPGATSQPGTAAGTVNGSFIPSATVVQDRNGFPMSKGSTGKYVSMIQQALNDRFNSELDVDGIFGTRTARALGAHGFNADAIYYKHFNEIVGYKYWT